MLDRRLVPLPRLARWLLEAKAPALEQSGEVGGVVFDPEHLQEHGCHPRSGPAFAAEAPGFGTEAKQPGDLRLLAGLQPRQPARRFPVAQSQRTLLPGAFEPLADRASAHSERLGDAARLPALLRQLPSPQASALTPIDRFLITIKTHGPVLPRPHPS
jgi:hypothetical protein